MKKYLKRIYRPLQNKLKYGDSDLDPVEFLVLEDRELVLLIISKVACTSIKATIGESYGIDFKKDSGLDIHSHEAWQRHFGTVPEQYRDFDTAVFIRDPFSRLVSCYKDRVLYPENHEDFRKYYFHNYPYPIEANCTFSEFVRSIKDIPDFMADRHFKSQSQSLSKLPRAPGFIGRFENLSDDWRRFARQYDFHEELARLNPSDRQNEKLEKDFRKYFDPASFQMVCERYAADLKQLYYQRSADQLRQYLLQNR